MAEIGIAYTLVGPDGTRAVVGNCDEARLDPDFVGYLDAENGVTGLLDTASVRAQTSDLIETDGATFGSFFLGGRTGTMQGIYLPDADMEVVNAADAKLRRATRALRADGVLTWTPSGEGAARMIRFRRQQEMRVTGRRPKAWQIALMTAQPYVLSADELNVDIDPDNPAGEIGITDPITDPIVSELNVSAQTFVVNEGDAPTWPRFRIRGPMTNPVILNNTTGEALRIVYTLAAGDYLDVYPELGAILLNGATNQYSALDFANSTWWQLQPGINDVRILPTAYSAGALVTAYWRSAWE